MSYRSTDTGWAGVIVLAVFLSGALIIGAVKANTSHNETITVQSKERVCDGGQSCRYLVWTDKGVYENTDSLFAGKWDSSDVQGALKEKHTYEVEARGWRIPFMSAYPNIIQVRHEVAK